MNDRSNILANVVRQYLSARKNKTAVVTDAASIRYANEVLPDAMSGNRILLCNIDGVDRILDRDQEIAEWVTYSLFDESRIRRTLARKATAARRPTIKITSSLNNLFITYLSSDLRPAGPALHSARARDLLHYAIICAPRCGSTYLTELLASVGLGYPQEHLRNREISALSGLQVGSADAKLLLTEFFWRHQKNSIFGTKLISHYLFKCLSEISCPAEIVDSIIANFRIIYLVRRDKVGQAISDFLANKSGIWHVRDQEVSRSLDEIHEQVEYSFDDVLQRHQFMLQEDSKLTGYVQGTNHQVYFYEDLVKDPQGVTAAIARFIGREDIGLPDARVMRMESSVNTALRQRFAADYRARFQADPDEYIPSGLRVAF